MVKALVLYHSQQVGNTAALAKAVAEGLKEGGCQVDMFNTNEGRFDITKFPQYKGVAFGSPDYYSYIAGGLKTFMDDHFIADVQKKMEGMKDKPYVLFYTYGGGGRVKDAMVKLFSRVGTLVGEPVGFSGKPDEQILEKCRVLGKELNKAIS